MFRKILSVLLIAALAAAFAPTVGAAREYPQLELDCKAALLMEYSSGEILFAKNENEPLPMASVTKIMSILLICEALDAGSLTLDETVTASAHAAGMGGSQIYLEENETMSVSELLKSVVVASANDACVALAEHVAGGESEFVARMNKRASELGMTNTSFANCTGLDAENHHSSAYDIALMSCELLSHDVIFTFTSIWTDSVRGGEFGLTNTNKLIRFYEGANGLKTGSTDDAGFCVSATAKRSGMQLIAVVMGSSTGTARFEAAKTMLNYGFAGFRLQPLEQPVLPEVRVRGGTVEYALPGAYMPQALLVEKSFSQQIEYRIETAENLTAPVEAGDVIGKITWFAGSETVYELDLCACSAIPRRTFGFCLRLLFARFLKI